MTAVIRKLRTQQQLRRSHSHEWFNQKKEKTTPFINLDLAVKKKLNET